MATIPPCECGLYAVGECVGCGAPKCGTHGAVIRGRFRCVPCRRRHAADIAQAVERRKEVLAQKRAERERERIERVLRAAGFEGRAKLNQVGLRDTYASEPPRGHRLHRLGLGEELTLCGLSPADDAPSERPTMARCGTCEHTAARWREDLLRPPIALDDEDLDDDLYDDADGPVEDLDDEELRWLLDEADDLDKLEDADLAALDRLDLDLIDPDRPVDVYDALYELRLRRRGS